MNWELHFKVCNWRTMLSPASPLNSTNCSIFKYSSIVISDKKPVSVFILKILIIWLKIFALRAQHFADCESHLTVLLRKQLFYASLHWLISLKTSIINGDGIFSKHWKNLSIKLHSVGDITTCTMLKQWRAFLTNLQIFYIIIST